MGQGYSSDLRVRIIGAIERGNSCRAAARRFGVSPSTSIRLAQRKARTGSLEPARQGRPPGGGKLAPHAELLIGWVEGEGRHHDAGTGGQAGSRPKAVTAHPASLSRVLLMRTVCQLKKNTAGQRGRARGRAPGAPGAGRRIASRACAKRSDRLVFLDETGTTTKMTRLRGRARRGQRLKG